MSDLIDNQFYPSAERIQCFFASLSGPDFDKKKSIFSDEVYFDLDGCVNNQNAFGVQKTRTYTLKSRRAQNESLFGVDFDPVA